MNTSTKCCQTEKKNEYKQHWHNSLFSPFLKIKIRHLFPLETSWVYPLQESNLKGRGVSSITIMRCRVRPESAKMFFCTTFVPNVPTIFWSSLSFLWNVLICSLTLTCLKLQGTLREISRKPHSFNTHCEKFTARKGQGAKSTFLINLYLLL